MSLNIKTRKKIPVVFNCDTGIDDAVALMIGVKSEKLDIKLIVTDVGNVAPNQAAKNTLNILDRYAWIEPAVDFSKVETVLVIINEK